MLVLSRKQQQEIAIGENIKITVIKIKGNTVRLGIDAPRDVKVVRGELPRQSEIEVELPQSSDEQVANVTIVFSDPVERTHSRIRSNEAEVLQFDKSAKSVGESRSISFRQTTPESLKRNRLKQIVNDISKTK